MTSPITTDSTASPASNAPLPPSSPLRGGFAPLTIGMFLLVALSAFEQLATTTIMPGAARELGGLSAFAVASAAALATGVVGTITAGIWADRRGPRRVIVAAVLSFALGLLLTGVAQDLVTLVAGRLVQGFGSGALTVAFYVVIGRLYPPVLHAKVFSAFAAAWVLPGLVGPVLAGTGAGVVGWGWVFLGAVAIVAIGVVAVSGAWRQPGEAKVRAEGKLPWARFIFAGLLAAGLVTLNAVTGIPGLVPSIVLTVVGLLIGVLAFRQLVPAGTLRAARGTPAIVATALLVFGGTFTVQAYLTLYLIERHGFSTAAAGLGLTLTGLTWPLASWLHSRFAAGWSSQRVLGLGIASLAIAIGTVAATAVLELDPWLAVGVWSLAGAGCGFAVPRLSSDVLRLAAPAEQGLASSALTVAQSVGPAVGIASASMLRVLAGPDLGFPAIFVAVLLAPLLALGIAWRMTPRATASDPSAGSAAPTSPSGADPKEA